MSHTSSAAFSQHFTSSSTSSFHYFAFSFILTSDVWLHSDNASPSDIRLLLLTWQTCNHTNTLLCQPVIMPWNCLCRCNATCLHKQWNCLGRCLSTLHTRNWTQRSPCGRLVCIGIWRKINAKREKMYDFLKAKPFQSNHCPVHFLTLHLWERQIKAIINILKTV